MSDAAAFEMALQANPDDLAGWCAYADYLAEQGDPRGEFMQTQLALEDENRSKEERDLLKAREAELHAREALQLDSSSLSARYTLGSVLSFLNSDEALPHLKVSADAYPRARLAGANLLERLGRKQEASEWRAAIQNNPGR